MSQQQNKKHLRHTFTFGEVAQATVPCNRKSLTTEEHAFRMLLARKIENIAVTQNKQHVISALDAYFAEHDDGSGQDSGKNSPKKQKGFTRILSPRSRSSVFDTHLSDLQKTSGPVPMVVIQSIVYLSDPGRLASEGIFRVPGDKTKVFNLCSEYKCPSTSVDLVAINPGTHVVANMLKDFFIRLPEPVIPPIFSRSMTKFLGMWFAQDSRSNRRY